MNLYKLSWKNITAKPYSMLLSIILLSFGVFLISIIILFNHNLKNKFYSNIKNIDMVVGAKGSPLQLILSSVFQIDVPTGNIPFSLYENLKKNRLLKSAIPLSFGDTYKGFRIVGSNQEYIQHFNGEIKDGTFFKHTMEVVMGSSVAKKLDLKVNDEFVSSHGLSSNGELHENQNFKVVGILKFSNTVLDQLIVTPTESIWEIHEHKEDSLYEDKKEITSILIKCQGSMGMVMIPNFINQQPNLQASMPSFEINKLFAMLGIGIDVFKWVSILFIIISGLSLFINIYSTIRERKYEMAILRCYGANKLKIITVFLQESIYLCLIGYFIGFILSRAGAFLFSIYIPEFQYITYNLNFRLEDFWIFIFSIILGILASIIPSIEIYKVDIAKVLSDN